MIGIVAGLVAGIVVMLFSAFRKPVIKPERTLSEGSLWSIYQTRVSERRSAEGDALAARDKWLETCRLEEVAKSAWLRVYRDDKAERELEESRREHYVESTLTKLDTEIDAARPVEEAPYRKNAKV